MIIGITGSIGSGKTTAAKIFSRHWYTRIDADEIGHQIIKNKEVKDKIIKNFGNSVLDKNKQIDRAKLGDIVFDNSAKLKKLNSITHLPIIKKIKNRVKNIEKKCGDKTRIVIDAPLLLETKTKNLVDKVVLIKANKENILKRLNRKYPKGKIERILKAQMPPNKKIKYADFVIDNNKDLKHLEKQVKEIINKLDKK